MKKLPVFWPIFVCAFFGLAVPSTYAHDFKVCSDCGWGECCWEYTGSCNARPDHPNPDCQLGHVEVGCGCDWYSGCGCVSIPGYCRPDIVPGMLVELPDGIDNDCDYLVDDEACDNIDNDGDGFVDEDVRSCLLRILFVPLDWGGTQADFEAAAARQLALFRNSLSLTGCIEKVGAQYLSVATDNLPAPTCPVNPTTGLQECGLREVQVALNNLTLTVNLSDFDLVAALTDGNPCGNIAGCSNGVDLIWAETIDDSVIGHEVGHVLALGDEYCSQDAGSTCGNCNGGSSTTDFPNYLGADLGCDPANGAGCCNSCAGTIGQCVDDYFVCCDGNDNSLGGKCIMSFANAAGPRSFCNRCVNYLTNPDDPRSSDNPDGQTPMQCSYTYPGLNHVLSVDYSLTEAGKLSVHGISVGFGRLGLGRVGTAGRYSLEVRNSAGDLLASEAFDLSFAYAGPALWGVDYSGIRLDKVERRLRARLLQDVSSSERLSVLVLKDGTLLSESCLLTDGGGSDPTGRLSFVADHEPPSLNCPNDATVECSATGGVPRGDDQLASFFSSVSAEDNCDASPVLSNNSPNLFGLGNTSVTFTASDVDQNASTCLATVTVIDSQPPAIDSVTASSAILWPPDHRMIPVSVTPVFSDICDAGASCRILSVVSNEPINGLGDGDTAPDWEITGNLSLNLRSERAGMGQGRIYTITVECGDGAGNTATKEVVVTVPLDMRRK